jgi:hypothetical protein
MTELEMATARGAAEAQRLAHEDKGLLDSIFSSVREPEHLSDIDYIDDLIVNTYFTAEELDTFPWIGPAPEGTRTIPEGYGDAFREAFYMIGRQLSSAVFEPFMRASDPDAQELADIHRGVAIACVASWYRKNKRVPEHVLSETAMEKLREIASLHPTLVASHWYRNADSAQLEAFHEDWRKQRMVSTARG